SLESLRQQWLERARRTQFNIEIFCVRQKSRKQLAAFGEGQFVCAAFPRVARGDDFWRFEDRYFAFNLIEDMANAIESKFEKIRRLLHPNGEPQVRQRSDYADNVATLCRPGEAATTFDPFARCHIINVSQPREER